jgi:predicted enzyme related to lactoylglutathione lyase
MTKRNIVHIEIPTENARRSGEFYEKLFGWHIEHDEQMDYTMWDPHEGPGGGFSQLDENVKVGDVLLYVNSEDIEADLKMVEQLGGKVLAQKSEIPNTGWYAVFQDPTGNTIALHQYEPGTQPVNSNRGALHSAPLFFLFRRMREIEGRFLIRPQQMCPHLTNHQGSD